LICAVLSNLRKSIRSASRNTSGKGVQFSANPLRAAWLRPWCSHLVMLVMFADFATLAGHTIWRQAHRR
jgi:hypothetical protein